MTIAIEEPLHVALRSPIEDAPPGVTTIIMRTAIMGTVVMRTDLLRPIAAVPHLDVRAALLAALLRPPAPAGTT